jgi:L-asparaginase II
MIGLVNEYRGNVLENVHPGRICVVGDSGEITSSAGDALAMTFFRSTSKPLISQNR